ncbi:hypothetical protein K438DRAFT_1882058 [Mycena galopus ATCC 62051]|nr:hypothetical protein K438DRAFT_1882058 [Mycena galopus ATCC 62051]
MALFSFLHKLRPSFNPTESPQYPPSHLLSLPYELRLQIYDVLLDCQVGRPRRRKRARKRSERTPPLAIPWLPLMLVCKTIADELRHHIRHALGNATYHLEVALNKYWRSNWYTVTWRRIPCSPSSVHTLQIDLVFTRFWSSGHLSASELTLVELALVLNHFIHKGPMLLRKRPLREHIHLDTLIFQIRIIEGAPDLTGPHEPYDKESVDSTEKRLRGDLEQHISRLVEQGVLFGAVDKIVCRPADSGGTETNWDVCRKDIAPWTHYGSSWGIAGSSSLKSALQRTKWLW